MTKWENQLLAMDSADSTPDYFNIEKWTTSAAPKHMSRTLHYYCNKAVHRHHYLTHE